MFRSPGLIKHKHINHKHKSKKYSTFLRYLHVIKESKIVENVDQVEWKPGAHEDDDHADEEGECPLASQVLGLSSPSARPGPEGEAGELLVNTEKRRIKRTAIRGQQTLTNFRFCRVS